MQPAGQRPPPTAAETVATVIGLVAVLGATVFVVWQLRPDLLFSSNMDVGGDNAGHVVTPYFLIHDLLPQGRITGWDPQWFEGFPLYVFYFPLPALFVAALSLVFSYAVAFKLVTVLGLVTLPAAAWLFGHLAGFKRPVPVLMAAAMLPYLFNTSYTIDGGNITSTLAGEFSFSLALTSGLLFLAVFVYALRTGRLRWLAATLYAVTLLCHVVPAIAYAAVAILLSLAHWNKNTWRVLVPVGLVGALLAAFWLVPFGVDLPFGSSMGYTRVIGLWANILPDRWTYLWVLIPTAIGVVMAVVRRNRTALVLAVSIVAAAAGFQWLPAGFIYNGRWLPFYFLFTALLAAYGIGGLALPVGRWLQLDGWQVPVFSTVGTLVAILASCVVGGLGLPGFPPTASQIQVSGWVSWNYTGFQGKTGWPVYQQIVRMLDTAGRTYGCGRLQYEYITETQDPFGSTEATMALPYWTNGCMDTIDGVLFESSTTTPFHFLDQAEYSLPGESSNPVAYLTYPSFDLADGIRHLRFADVRYFMAVSPEVEQAAKSVPGLVKIASTAGFPGSINGSTVSDPEWDLYLIEGSQLVTPLTYLPEVESASSANQWLDTNLTWWEDETYWPVELALNGPANWPRAPVGTLLPPSEAIPVVPTTVSHESESNSAVSFDVGRLGSPVLVKVPYFPNWHAAGALGPYEVSPNLMAVVPTSHHVTLTYGTTTADELGKVASLGGVVGLGMLMTLRTPVMNRPPPAPEPAPAPGDDHGPEGVVAASAEEEPESQDAALAEAADREPEPRAPPPRPEAAPEDLPPSLPEPVEGGADPD